MAWWIDKPANDIAGSAAHEYFKSVADGGRYMVDSILCAVQITDENGNQHCMVYGDRESGVVMAAGLASIITQDSIRHIHEIGDDDDAS